MPHYSFSIDEEGWDVGGSPGQFAHDPLNGTPAGCLAGIVHDGQTGATGIAGLSIPVLTGDPISWRVRVVVEAGSGDPADVSGSLDTGLGQVDFNISVTTFPFDSGWQLFSDVIDSDGTITDLAVSAGTPVLPDVTVYIDEIFIAETPASPYDYTRSAGGIPGSVMI